MGGGWPQGDSEAQAPPRKLEHLSGPLWAGHHCLRAEQGLRACFALISGGLGRAGQGLPKVQRLGQGLEAGFGSPRGVGPRGTWPWGTAGPSQSPRRSCMNEERTPPLGGFQSPLGLQPGRHFCAVHNLPDRGRWVCCRLSRKSLPSPLPSPLRATELTGALLCPRPDPGAKSPGCEGLPGLLPHRGAP